MYLYTHTYMHVHTYIYVYMCMYMIHHDTMEKDLDPIAGLEQRLRPSFDTEPHLHFNAVASKWHQLYTPKTQVCQFMNPAPGALTLLQINGSGAGLPTILCISFSVSFLQLGALPSSSPNQILSLGLRFQCRILTVGFGA